MQFSMLYQTAGYPLVSDYTMDSLLPAVSNRVLQKLEEHGNEVVTLEEATTFDGEMFLVSEVIQGRECQGHTMTMVNGRFEETEKSFPAGSFMVDLAQPLAYLAFYSLEPEPDDSLTTWNYFDEAIGEPADSTEVIEFPVFKYYR